ncbi:hypothetical protein ACEQPO_01610 [Bacillus sp. SL00103]
MLLRSTLENLNSAWVPGKAKAYFASAEDRGVPVIEYANMSYTCCGLIRPLEQTS